MKYYVAVDEIFVNKSKHNVQLSGPDGHQLQLL